VDARFTSLSHFIHLLIPFTLFLFCLSFIFMLIFFFGYFTVFQLRGRVDPIIIDTVDVIIVGTVSYCCCYCMCLGSVGACEFSLAESPFF
jgi:hypothetical protein